MNEARSDDEDVEVPQPQIKCRVCEKDLTYLTGQLTNSRHEESCQRVKTEKDSKSLKNIYVLSDHQQVPLQSSSRNEQKRTLMMNVLPYLHPIQLRSK